MEIPPERGRLNQSGFSYQSLERRCRKLRSFSLSSSFILAMMVMAPVPLMPLPLRLRLGLVVVVVIVVACRGVFPFIFFARIKAQTLVLDTEVIHQPGDVLARKLQIRHSNFVVLGIQIERSRVTAIDHRARIRKPFLQPSLGPGEGHTSEIGA